MTAQDASFSPRHGGRPRGEEHEEEDIKSNLEAAGSRAVQICRPEQSRLAELSALLRSAIRDFIDLPWNLLATLPTHLT